MFIRETKTKNKKTGVVYTKHTLVESVWADNTSRQRTIMQLGHLDLPKSEWKKLAHALECQFTGQATILDATDGNIESLARSLYSGYDFSKRLKEGDEDKNQGDACFAEVNLNDVHTSVSRGLGAELVCQKAWSLLDMEEILTEVGLNEKERSLASAVVFGKLISPGSEKQTYEWFQTRSALNELRGHDISKTGKDAFYEIGDRLYENKQALEEHLYKRERQLFPQEGHTIFLYDLTNTYMEGSCLGNNLAMYGHCKSKRKDLRLVTLSLVVTGDGLPVYSHIYKGNQSEPETMKDMILRIEEQISGGQLPIEKPTIAMDCGIATKGNVAYLEENGYPYIVVKREDAVSKHMAEFLMERDSFDLIDHQKKSVYGDENKVYIKKMEAKSGDKTCKVLCISEGREKKEEAIDQRGAQRLLEDVDQLNASIAKGNIVSPEVKLVKMRNLLMRHSRIAKRFLVKADFKEDGQTIAAFRLEKNPETPPAFYGCYVIESTHVELEGEKLWKLYMTLSMVESAFRSMKSTLGMRPVYHQTARRTEAHLFITVLAYHLLITIEKLLEAKGDHRIWKTIRSVLSTHIRSTVILRGKNGEIYHIRTSGVPEEAHQDIYDKLSVRNFLKNKQIVIQNVKK
jgi:transposase